MTPKFLADADLNHKIVVSLRRREPAVDILDAHRGEVIGLADPDVLAVAAATGRILVSHDHKTMPGHFNAFIQQQSSPGVFLVAQSVDIGKAVDELLLVWATSDSAEWVNQLNYLPL